MRILMTAALIAITSLLSAQSNAEKAINATLDQLKAAIDAKDFAAFKAFYTEDVAIYGTDPDEAPFATAAAMKQMEGVFASDQVDYKYDLIGRDIHLMQGGKTAIVVEQGKSMLLSKNIPYRAVYHLTKSGGTWQINFHSIAFVPENEDVGKIDAAVEK